jgi:hypothetical protein
LFRTALTDFFSGHGKGLAYVGTAMALTGAGVATAAAASSPAAPGMASATHHVSVGDDAGASTSAGAATFTAGHQSARVVTSTAGGTAAHKTADAAADAASHTPAHAASHTPAHAASHTPAHAARHTARKSRVHVVRHARGSMTWTQVRDALASRTYPKAAAGKLPLADRLQPGQDSGPQSFMPITASRMANATTIVRQALNKHMGVRSAVIAVATAMQESTLENINYGDRDSLGLFQQRPSCGWGSAAQITDPAYAANAFLSALHAHQQADPGWAGQPLWQNAQSVQESGFPTAYAKWESQAAQLVSSIARHMV